MSDSCLKYAKILVFVLFDWQIKLYYYDTVIERFMESKLEVHRSKTLAEATEIAWKVVQLSRLVLNSCCVLHNSFKQELPCCSISLYSVSV